VDDTPAVADLATTLPVVFEHQVRVEEVDAGTVDLLAQELEALRTDVARSLPPTATAMVVVDLGRVAFLGAAGLHCLADAAEQLAAAGHRMMVVNPCRIVAGVLALDPSGHLTD
jgi:anti-anti-sigma factor